MRTADLAGGASAQLDWSGIPAQARDRVEQELRSYQRLIPLADSTADRLALKRAGYDSALAITDQPEEEFVRTSGLDEGRARVTYARAHSAAASVAQHYAGAAPPAQERLHQLARRQHRSRSPMSCAKSRG